MDGYWLLIALLTKLERLNPVCRLKNSLSLCRPPPPLQDAPFFTEKLNVRTLPCILCFVDGVAVDRVVGFDELGGKDTFPTSRLAERLVRSGAVKAPPKPRCDDDDDE